jgi:HEAT repeat protein
MTTESQVSDLILALKHSEGIVRFQAAYDLGRMAVAAAAAVPDLIQALQVDESEGMRYNAARALGRIGDPSAIPALTHALQGDARRDVRYYAAQALGRIGDPSAIPALTHALSDGDRTVREAAAQALELLK